MTIYVKHNGEVKSAIPYVKHNGSVKIPTSGWAKTDGELKQIWPPTSGDTAYIYNQATLEAFRDRVNAGETSLNAKVIADITLTGTWTPIANYASNTSLQYTGTFDGGGYTITGLTINSESSYQGLFGYIGTDGTVKNLNLAGTSVTGNGHVGAIAGRNNNGMVENCTNEGNVTNTNTSGVTGGIVGWNNGGTVEGCTNDGDVTATGTSGYAGGIVGWNDGGTVEGCTNSGSVSGSEATGGIVGSNNSGTVSGNTNDGDVTATGTSGLAGGIVGYNNGGTVSGNTNDGDVTATGTSGLAGGIVGYNNGTVSGNINTGTVTGTNITPVS